MSSSPGTNQVGKTGLTEIHKFNNNTQNRPPPQAAQEIGTGTASDPSTCKKPKGKASTKKANRVKCNSVVREKVVEAKGPQNSFAHGDSHESDEKIVPAASGLSPHQDPQSTESSAVPGKTAISSSLTQTPDDEELKSINAGRINCAERPAVKSHTNKQTVPAAPGVNSHVDPQQAVPFSGLATAGSSSAPVNNKKRPRAAPGEKKFPCPVENCGKAYTTKKTLKNHSKVYENATQSHDCQRCNTKFPTSISLNKHFGIAHRSEFKCSLCTKYFGRCGLLRKHIQDDHPEADVADTLVGIHLKQEHGSTRIFLCSVCSYWNTEEFLFKDHVGKRHKANGTTAVIAKGLADAQERDNARFNSYTCTLCRWKTPNAEDITNHIEVAHPSELENILQISAAILGTMKVDEVSNSSPDNIYHCYHCQRYVGKSNHALYKHIKQRHEEWDIKELHVRSLAHLGSEDLIPQRNVPWFRCNVCQKPRRRLANIRKHFQRNHKDHVMAARRDDPTGQPSFWVELPNAEAKAEEEKLMEKNLDSDGEEEEDEEDEEEDEAEVEADEEEEEPARKVRKIGNKGNSK